MSRPRTRLRLLEQLFQGDLDRAKLCCAFDRDALRYVGDLVAHLEATPEGAELSQAPPVLPFCRKAASPCPEGCEHAARVWGRLRRVAVMTAGLSTEDL